MRARRGVILGLLVLACLIGGLLYLVGVAATDPVDRRRAFAIARMVTGLILLWVGLGGGLMYRFRATIRARVLPIRLNWRLKFVLFATTLACLEEAVTVSMTNLAPVFGSRIGEAYITASAQYLDVIALHSVVVFIPLFIALALLLGRYDFKPFAVFLAFGLVGTLVEAIFSGALATLLTFPLWVFVYGLMVWLPAFCLPQNRSARPVGWLHHALFAPAILLVAMPMILPVVYVITGILDHPSIDFDPP